MLCIPPRSPDSLQRTWQSDGRNLSSRMRRWPSGFSERPGRCWLVDPGRGRDGRWCRCASDEALGRTRVFGGQDLGALGADLVGAAVVDGGRGHQPDPGVPVRVVVVVKEVAAERACVLDAVKASREGGPVLQRLELRL